MASNKHKKSILLAKFPTCAYCGTKYTGYWKDEKYPTIDHFIPKHLGGNSELYNLVIACQKCNNQKTSKHPEEWYKAQTFYCTKRWAKILSHVGGL